MPRPASRQILGSCVVLPEPVSPQTMTTGGRGSPRGSPRGRPRPAVPQGTQAGARWRPARRGPRWRPPPVRADPQAPRSRPCRVPPRISGDPVPAAGAFGRGAGSCGAGYRGIGLACAKRRDSMWPSGRAQSAPSTVRGSHECVRDTPDSLGRRTRQGRLRNRWIQWHRPRACASVFRGGNEGRVYLYARRASRSRRCRCFQPAMPASTRSSLDTADRVGMVRAADEVQQVFGNVHLLVNNAGVGITKQISTAAGRTGTGR